VLIIVKLRQPHIEPKTDMFVRKHSSPEQLNMTSGHREIQCQSDSRRVFGLDIGLIDHFTT
jgi:hypothetical protein